MVLLWLKWVASFLSYARGFAPLSRSATIIAHHWLDGVERALFRVILCRIALRIRTIPKLRHAAQARIETHFMRALIGSRMRRAFRSCDLNQRIAALSQDVGGLVSQVLKRIPRGFTRRRPCRAHPEPRPGARATLGAAAACAANTS